MQLGQTFIVDYKQKNLKSFVDLSMQLRIKQNTFKTNLIIFLLFYLLVPVKQFLLGKISLEKFVTVPKKILENFTCYFLFAISFEIMLVMKNLLLLIDCLSKNRLLEVKRSLIFTFGKWYLIPNIHFLPQT
ncbi:hypothetical protein BpHYR1_025090 [Brachionus plicatilis]|uniref:Transmembrane protein n=1 Tax=Brachionus plicatilis TaxID=10195 RepID=A0A3M7RGS1_BRAPC|nr:hypothetical protein BpHYR1_025090 [Brachionus plicatilis]